MMGSGVVGFGGSGVGVRTLLLSGVGDFGSLDSGLRLGTGLGCELKAGLRLTSCLDTSDFASTG